MAFILNIETATALCSVGLFADGKILAQRETLEEKSHASMLTAFIDDLIKEQNIRISDLDAIAVGKGPGSYTGLRIGVSAAKGLCYGAGLPLIAISTLKILFRSALSALNTTPGKNSLFCPMIDARRMEVYSCIYDEYGNEIEPIAAVIIDKSSFRQHLDEKIIYFFGSGMEKCRDVLDHPNAVFIPDIYPHAGSLAFLAEESYKQKIFEDIAYFEPFYLKDFIATIPKKGLHF
jgi:tRNA threonylcarbamoyladenosine biosynthesis protein TsaB